MSRAFVSPAFLVLALAALIGAFTILWRDEPDVTMAIHQARLGDDEEHRQRLEDDLEARRLWRRVAIGALFGATALFAALAFLTIPTHRPPPAPSSPAPQDPPQEPSSSP